MAPHAGVDWPERKEHAVLPLPKISLVASDYPRLERLARAGAQRGDMDAVFLMGEINRAEIVPDEACEIEPIVTIGAWVTYWTNWGAPRKTVQLVWPEDGIGDPAQISVLSALGAALIGLRAGDQMPYFVACCLNVVRVQSVKRCEANVIPLFHAARAFAKDDPVDDDPGPTAA
jgi:transcription elongation GreA/GreB family factor